MKAIKLIYSWSSYKELYHILNEATEINESVVESFINFGCEFSETHFQLSNFFIELDNLWLVQEAYRFTFGLIYENKLIDVGMFDRYGKLQIQFHLYEDLQ